MSHYYYSDSDDTYQARRHHPSTNTRHYTRRSGLASKLRPTSPSNDESAIRIVVDSPFPRKSDFFIDTSQRGRIIVTARYRRSTNSSNYIDYRKYQDVVQTFKIPHDADIAQLTSYVERDGNLVIDIPRRHYSYRDSFDSQNTNVGRSRDVYDEVEQMLTLPTSGPSLIRDKNASSRHGDQKKLEYRIDCTGYAQEDLEVFIQGHDLIVQGERKSANPNRNISKKFSRKITLPPDVNLSKVVSYLDTGINGGELRVEAPLYEKQSNNLRRRDYQIDEYDDYFPQRSSSLDFDRQIRRQRHQRHRDEYDYRLDPSKRIRSADGYRYPLYVPPQEEDFDRSSRQKHPHRRIQNYERRIIDRSNPKSHYGYHTSRMTNHKDADLRF
ncbi:unnamed protein product [Didymodactylos carnosus]|uniref:SHSP domain-containing protein n=1 Tax=Didymodactylos carnosus TaxID=1234261 RepID=A0A814R703_9BILA|nr:unnamed protein product [Didymodactylos carnosus]CAF1129457.1 unnamed protein product [Didymodactylos carnosus]CAF3751548.1 unnamed protein product [Didymodactylos carnosus]CAF3893160.1 unnamed protein product [Didymodactylos carnosus]